MCVSELSIVEGENIVKPPVRRCASEKNVCKQVCLDVEDGIKCSCFDGYRLEGSSCIGIPIYIRVATMAVHFCILLSLLGRGGKRKFSGVFSSSSFFV